MVFEKVDIYRGHYHDYYGNYRNYCVDIYDLIIRKYGDLCKGLNEKIGYNLLQNKDVVPKYNFVDGYCFEFHAEVLKKDIYHYLSGLDLNQNISVFSDKTDKIQKERLISDFVKNELSNLIETEINLIETSIPFLCDVIYWINEDDYLLILRFTIITK